MAQISVIVAVYKMPEFLPRCIEGILGQTFRDLELILVDDGSPDHCGRICDEYAARDPRVKVIHKENAGVGAARNTGLDWVYSHSDSQWIFFHDNDDWIHPETLERLFHAAQELEVKISICGYQETEGADPQVEASQLQPVRWKPKDLYMTHFVNATVCWGKLYHRDVFDGKRYPPGKYVEDEFLTYRLLFSCPAVSVIHAPLYAYFINRAGITKKRWVPKRLEVWEAFEQQLDWFQDYGDPELLHFRYRNYIDNAKKQMADAREVLEGAEGEAMLRSMVKRLRPMLRKAWKGGHIDFFFDFDLLNQCLPLRAKVFRKWVEWKAPKEP